MFFLPISRIFFVQKSYSNDLKAVLFVLTHIVYMLKVIKFLSGFLYVLFTPVDSKLKVYHP